jgi:hypothetical protein
MLKLDSLFLSKEKRVLILLRLYPKNALFAAVLNFIAANTRTSFEKFLSACRAYVYICICIYIYMYICMYGTQRARVYSGACDTDLMPMETMP